MSYMPNYGRRNKRKRSEESWSPQQSDSSWEDDNYPKKKGIVASNGQTFERVRGRPRGHKRAPLTKEEQRKRNAFYERDRREKLAEGWRELRESMETDAPQNKLLVDATPYVKFMERKMHLFEGERNFQQSRNAALRAKLKKLKASVKVNPEVMVMETYKKTQHVKQEYADSGVHSTRTSIRSSNPSFSSPDLTVPTDFRAPSPESRVQVLNSRTPEYTLHSSEYRISNSKPTISLPVEKLNSSSICTPYPASTVCSPKPRVCLPSPGMPIPNVKIPNPDPRMPPSQPKVAAIKPIISSPATKIPSPQIKLDLPDTRIPTSEPLLSSEPKGYFYNNHAPFTSNTTPYPESRIPLPDHRVPFLDPLISLDDIIPPPYEDVYDYVEATMKMDFVETHIEFLESHYNYSKIPKSTSKPAQTVPITSLFSFKIEENMTKYWGEDIHRQLMEFEKEFDVS